MQIPTMWSILLSWLFVDYRLTTVHNVGPKSRPHFALDFTFVWKHRLN